MPYSQSQRRAAGAALSARRGKMKVSKLFGASKQMFESMTTKQLEDFAKGPIKKKRKAR